MGMYFTVTTVLMDNITRVKWIGVMLDQHLNSKIQSINYMVQLL